MTAEIKRLIVAAVYTHHIITSTVVFQSMRNSQMQLAEPIHEIEKFQ